MKIILTGATGVLGSHIVYEILEHFIQHNISGKLILIARNKGKNTASERIEHLLNSTFVPSFLKKQGYQKLQSFIEVLDSDLSNLSENFPEKYKDAYFIHSAGYVNLSTDEDQKDKIFEENATTTKKFSTLFLHL